MLLPVAAVFVTYVLLRVLLWQRTVLLEDHDSVGYLRDLQVIRALEPRFLTPDSNPFYPAASALLGLLPVSEVTAARLCSLVFSVVLFLVCWRLGRQLADRRAALAALVLLSFSPVLIPLSISVLAEPTYIALVYLGLWLFWSQLTHPRPGRAMLTGVVFAVAFLTRVEGLVFLVLLPLLQAGYLLAAGELRARGRGWLRWTAAYAAAFGLVATPQVLRVSQQMGELAINGRQVWSALVTHADGRAPAEKIYGLDHSPAEINLFFVQARPEARRDLASGLDLMAYPKRAARTFDDILRHRLGTLIGPLPLVFFAFGILVLLELRRRFEVVLIFGFLAGMLAGPLLQEPLLLRHLAATVPLVLLVAGVGVVDLAARLAPRERHRPVALLALLGATLLTMALPLRDIARPPAFNPEYSPASLAGPLAAAEALSVAERRRPHIASRMAYFPYFADGIFLRMPYTDYPGLLTYLAAHRTDLLFLEHRHLAGYPFLERFQGGSPPTDFELLYRGTDALGGTIELYRVLPRPRSAAPAFVAPWSQTGRHDDG